MTKLGMLGKPYINDYNAKQVFVHVGYGEEYSPTDHLENPLGVDDASVFEQHIKDAISPELKKLLAKSLYTVSNTMDYPFNSTLPAMVICRRDGQSIGQSEMAAIQQLLTDAINKINEQALSAKSVSALSGRSLFSSQAASAAQSAPGADARQQCRPGRR